MAAIDSARDYLQKENVYSHLGQIIEQVIDAKPQNACHLAEVLSRVVKQPTSQEPVTDEDVEALKQYVKKARELDQVPKEEDAPITVCAIPDFVEEAEMLSWAGVGFGEIESYKVMCSLRNLAAKEKDAGLVRLRLWGKILGTEADYYVAEAQKDGGGDEELEPDAEPAGTGANQYTYYVTTDLCGSWHKLPDIKPREIVAARSIKRLVSGNPKAQVITHPYFDGKEEVLLRAMIARINADTVICIKGYLKREEEEDAPIEENTEFVSPPPAALLSQEAWTHMQPHILLNGRTTYQEIADDDEEGTLAAKAKLEQEADPVRDVLRDLATDGLSWAIKQAGDTTLYKNPADPTKPRSNAVTYVRSLTWPGAVTAARGNHFVNLYVGYGLRAGDRDFFIPAPPDVQDEPEDFPDQEEPVAAPAEPVDE